MNKRNLLAQAAFNKILQINLKNAPFANKDTTVTEIANQKIGIMGTNKNA